MRIGCCSVYRSAEAFGAPSSSSAGQGPSPASSTSADVSTRVKISKAAMTMQKLATLEQSDPAKAQEALFEIAGRLTTAAASASGDSSDKFQELAYKFASAAMTGDYSEVHASGVAPQGLGKADRGVYLSAINGDAGSADASASMTVARSKAALTMQKLATLEQSDPAKAQEALFEIAGRLTTAAASASGDSSDKFQELAYKFASAAVTGDYSEVHAIGVAPQGLGEADEGVYLSAISGGDAGSADASASMTVARSKAAMTMQKLAALEQSDPAKAQEALFEIAGRLTTAAASASGDSSDKFQELAYKFASAAVTGDYSEVHAIGVAPQGLGEADEGVYLSAISGSDASATSPCGEDSSASMTRVLGHHAYRMQR